MKWYGSLHDIPIFQRVRRCWTDDNHQRQHYKDHSSPGHLWGRWVISLRPCPEAAITFIAFFSFEPKLFQRAWNIHHGNELMQGLEKKSDSRLHCYFPSFFRFQGQGIIVEIVERLWAGCDEIYSHADLNLANRFFPTYLMLLYFIE